MTHIPTRVRRVISEWQAPIGVVLTALAVATHLRPFVFGAWTNSVFVLCMAALVVVLFMGWITVRKRGQYLQLAKVSAETLGGQQFVDATLRRLAVRSVRPQHLGSDYPYDALTRVFARLGYNVKDAGLPAYLKR